MKTTKDCKEFIALNQKSLLTKNDKWKRIRKYKSAEYILRDFENEDGFILTIAEKNNALFIYSQEQSKKAQPALTENNVISKYGIKNGFTYIGKKAKAEDLTSFMAQCVQESVAMHSNPDDRLVYEDDYIDGVKASQWEVSWSENIKKFDEDSIVEFRLNYNEGIELDKKDIYKVHSLSMPDYDTAYRYVIFETHDHHLLLGFNYSD